MAWEEASKEDAASCGKKPDAWKKKLWEVEKGKHVVC